MLLEVLKYCDEKRSQMVRYPNQYPAALLRATLYKHAEKDGAA